jgi:hypothetical protein
METLLLIVGIITIAVIFFRRVPQPQVIYIPIEVAEEHAGHGCLPLIMAGFFILLVLAIIPF